MTMRIFIRLLLLCLIISSCTADKKKYVIGVSQCSEDNWRDKLNGEMLQSLYYYDNVELKIVSAYDNDRRQIAQIDSLVDSGIDLLVVSPNQMNTVTDVIDRAYDKGIPVILFDRKTDSGKYTAFIGGDNYEVGRVMGNYVASLFGETGGNIVEIQGLKGSSPTIDRHRGFMDVVSKYPKIRVLGSRYAGWLQDEARVQMDSIISKVDKIDCVYAQNDRMAMGAREAAAKHGLSDDIIYTGVDALSTPGGGMEEVRNGNISASYLYPTRGDLVMQLAVNILEGKPYKKDNYLKAALVTKNNVEQMLMQNEEMMSQTRRLETVHEKVDSYLKEYNHQKIYLVLVLTILALLLVFFYTLYHISVQKRRMVEASADAKLQFFTNVSHEFRTPLTLIADPVERLLDDSDLTMDQRRLLNVVDKNVKVVLRLVNGILDFRKTQERKMKLSLSTFGLQDTLEELVEGFMPAIEKHGIRMKVDVESGIMMTADYEKISSIVYNLLSNALKYTPNGGDIVLSASRVGGDVVLKVADNGVGIPKDDLHQVFDRFFQAENKSVGGTGIGLAVVKAFAELHGGVVSVKSVEGKGTEFTVSIPTDIHSDAVARNHSEIIIGDEFPVDGKTVEMGENSGGSLFFDFDDDCGERLKILVVDDNEDVRAYISSLMSGSCTVIDAKNGKDGLEKALREVPDLIVCDVMMPVMDGLEMCRRVKQETATSHIPVLLLTARTQEEQRAEGYDCGADAYITKPFSSKVLISRIKNLLENRRLLRRRYSSDEQTDERPMDADSVFIKSLRDNIKANMSDSDFSVEALSAAMGLSRVQLYRKVKAVTGSTPVELIRIMRLQRAERLLKSGGKNVAEVSYEVGYSSPSYFSKCFKEQFGRLPGEVS